MIIWLSYAKPNCVSNWVCLTVDYCKNVQLNVLSEILGLRLTREHFCFKIIVFNYLFVCSQKKKNNGTTRL